MSKNNLIQIGGELKNTTGDEVVADALYIKDYDRNKSQKEVNDNIEALSGYYTCGTADNEPAKEVTALGYAPVAGGSMKIKFSHANTITPVSPSVVTLKIGTAEAKPLYYNGEHVDATNTWEDDEVVEVYYDGTSFYANNVAGGSGSGDGVFDVSAKYPTSGVEGGNTYNLERALTVLNANLSASKKKGGMSIKFVQSSDHKYVQYRYMEADATTADTFTNVANWQGVDDVPTAGSENLVKSGGVAAMYGENYTEDFSISDESGYDIVRFRDGHIKTKEFDSSKNSVSNEEKEDLQRLSTVEIGAQVNNTETDTTDYDFSISDESGYNIVRFRDGHIKTKYFNSKDVVNTFSFPLPNFIGSPSFYIPTIIDTTGLATFDSVSSLYSAFDSLASLYPDWLVKEQDLGLDASGQFTMRHYTLRMQHPSIHENRAATGNNLWNDVTFKYRRILVNMSVHSNEKKATLGGYLAIKEILESNEPWATFIKTNFVIDIVPCNNPWGLDNGAVNVNSNNVNLNRDYRNTSNAQQETKNMKALIQELIPKGLVAVIDLHNASSSHGGYFVCKSNYKYYNYYAVLTQQMQALTYDLWEQVVSSMPSDGNYFHLWNYADSSGSVGQLHEYVDSLGLLGGTFEVKSNLDLEGSILSKVLCINYINAFGAFLG